jgi:hypothetical protein
MKRRSRDGEDAVVTIRFVKICKMKRRSRDGEDAVVTIRFVKICKMKGL